MVCQWIGIIYVDAVIIVTYLYAQRLEDSGGASDGELQLFNQSLHLFDLHLHLVHINISVGIGVLLHFFYFCCQLYYLFSICCQLGLIVVQLK